MAVLEKILSSKRAELPELRKRKLPTPPAHVPRVELKRASDEALHLICEIKRRSPSAGELSTALSVEERSRAYTQGGASMLSVLCDGPFFDGDFAHLLEARQGSELPLLCKEFVIDECQLDAAKAYGASAVLLIVRCLGSELGRFVDEATKRELVPLVEVFNEDEASHALDAGATFIGVNSRDLDTLVMNSVRAHRVVAGLPDHVTVAHLSGMKTQADVEEVARGRSDAALIGEVLMREDEPLSLLRALAEGARSKRTGYTD